MNTQTVSAQCSQYAANMFDRHQISGISGIIVIVSLCFSLVSMGTCPDAGTPGLPGIPGLPGRDGRERINGDKGDPGIPLKPADATKKGEKGEPGVIGSPGKRGRPGEAGDIGPPGPPGEPGDQGESGDTTSLLQSVFSVSRLTRNPPEPHAVIRFSKNITLINSHFNNEGKFVCQISGYYYFVFHASSYDKNLCVFLMVDGSKLATFCDHHKSSKSQQAPSGGLAVYLRQNQNVWLQTNSYNGMFAGDMGDSVFSGFLIHAL
ncbi:complement C1q subcomponent subunit C-like [Triplophysa rosa]|uniref:Complement C1q subcomponent subunit C n=1 Tax=Triplophysa rosa TaxID=992332 RepID=A0A9W7TFK6_TRIRA|nr:complement C1q subcomponent subunit C-like [Triplophysa rosa]KAI7795836.1 complement C1q subcomponent subunit C [Triplophysa rosa]